MMDTLVVAELSEQGVRKTTTLSAVSAAQRLANEGGGAFDILAIGQDADKAAQALSAYGARKILRAEIPGHYLCENYAATVADIARKGGYGVVLATASTFGKDLLPRVAAKLGAPLIADCSRVSLDHGKRVYRRPMYAGNVFATVEGEGDLHIVSVRQSEFDAAKPQNTASPIEQVAATSDAAAERIEFVGLETVERERPDLAEAEIVVSGGRALKSADNFKTVLEPLVDALGAAMGASRAACDAGYVPNDLQVGQTGKVVAPKLYIAVGISGAIQHLAGIKGSKVIVAINTDKEAPIAEVADYFLVEDLFTAVPALTEKVKAR